MNRILKQTFVIARRDFLAMVVTPTFLLFLIAPLFMLGFGVASGSGAAQLATSSAEKTRMVAIVAPETGARLLKSDAALRPLFRTEEAPPQLMIVKPEADVAQQAMALFKSEKSDVTAILSGPITAPNIRYQPPSDRHARYLAALAENQVRAERSGLATDKPLTRATITENSQAVPSQRGKQAAGFAAVFAIFFLTLLLAGQTVSMLAEEKSNKVIEILAAAVPLEAVFLGKLIGMFGVAVLFIAFWGILAAFASSFIPASAGIGSLAPAIGLPAFLALGAAYFSMAYMLLGAVFLGVGSQASTMREIQMMSLPITIFQVSMFGLSSAAAGRPGSDLATFAQIFPFSSPFAMAARGATDAALWPHLLALGWQAIWVGITIWISVRIFRIGVLKSGTGFRGLWARLTGKVAA
jgi:ABC-2 type transport system permease protein